ncbi:inositol 1,4,5-trisphosphate receptor-interacting protein-like 1 [Protobothrops mucrosquamatus]|uniref:inositol 1,4,5-trisphosphate receptor-interacting protein-like 1 n=1 Tax=Protobothrops mucrosquamatus TaxID=103944 RepID=UPI0010FAF2E3|nr:inositol 1,4,5-trisphosphate receptor-interacting protein-like 1 [Protobothrops mucrosquamatus]
MAIVPLLFLAALALVHHPLLVNDITDLATLNRLQEHETRLTTEMGRLQVEMDQKNWNWDLKQNREQWITEDVEAGGGTWDGWPYVGLVIILLFGCCRRTAEKEPNDDSSTDSSSTTTNGEDFEDTDQEPEDYQSKQKLLEAFYEQQIETGTGDMPSLCDFVEMLVNDLIEESRNQNLLLLENCIGVGSAFEGWSTEASKTFCILVPILPPKGHSFHIETSDSEGAPGKHGHILVEAECLCKRERLLGDVVCSLHHPERELSQEEQSKSLMHVLCTSSHLDGEKTIQWFQALVNKVWDALAQKYNLSLTIQNSNKTCRLKLELQSRKEIFIDILLGVQQGDSLIFLTTQDGQKGSPNGMVWHRSFAVQELLFFKWVSQRAPKDSCHLKCLQILIFFRESSTPDKKNPVLTNYHYKTCLMHLLLFRPLSYWEPEQIAQRLQDLLLHMNTALEQKYLEHFLIGNISLPIQIPLPKSLRSAVPFNLFEYLAQDPRLHAKAINEFVQVVEQVRTLWLAPEE